MKIEDFSNEKTSLFLHEINEEFPFPMHVRNKNRTGLRERRVAGVQRLQTVSSDGYKFGIVNGRNEISFVLLSARWCRGYNMCLTHRGSLVQIWPEASRPVTILKGAHLYRLSWR